MSNYWTTDILLLFVETPEKWKTAICARLVPHICLEVKGQKFGLTIWIRRQSVICNLCNPIQYLNKQYGDQISFLLHVSSYLNLWHQGSCYASRLKFLLRLSKWRTREYERSLIFLKFMKMTTKQWTVFITKILTFFSY